MMTWIDARVPVRLGAAETALPGEAVLLEGADFDPPTSAHPVACDCCVSRTAAAMALDRLFLRRVRGEVPFFRAVLVACRTEAGVASVRSALEEDPVVSARFRAAQGMS